MINQEEDTTRIMMLLASHILAGQCSKVRLLILWLVARAHIVNSMFLAVGILGVVEGIAQGNVNKNNIGNLHRNNIAQRHMLIIDNILNKTLEKDLMEIIKIEIMETTDKNLILSINSVLAKIGNGKDRQNGVNRCDDNVKNKSMSPILNTILEYPINFN